MMAHMIDLDIWNMLLFQKICDFVVTTALCVYRNRCDPIMPYSDWRCRLHLLKVLQACIMTPHTEGPSPLQCAITIFKMAEQDNNLQVGVACYRERLEVGH